MQRRSAQFGGAQSDLGKRWFYTAAVAQVALSVPAFFGYHLRERGHDVEMKPIHLIVESPCVPGALGSENLHRMFDVPFLFCGDGGKGLAETSRSGPPDTGQARKVRGLYPAAIISIATSDAR